MEYSIVIQGRKTNLQNNSIWQWHSGTVQINVQNIYVSIVLSIGFQVRFSMLYYVVYILIWVKVGRCEHFYDRNREHKDLWFPQGFADIYLFQRKT